MLLLNVIRDTTEGKMFCEREYASCTKRIAQMLEESGQIDDACKIIQEI
jgi:hypothetical protein